jgi:hypothetical protein
MVEIDDMDRQFRVLETEGTPDKNRHALEGVVLQEHVDKVFPDRAGRADDKGFHTGNVSDGQS